MPSMTVEYLLYKCNIKQFFMWRDRAIEVITGEHIKKKSEKKKEIDAIIAELNDPEFRKEADKLKKKQENEIAMRKLKQRKKHG